MIHIERDQVPALAQYRAAGTAQVRSGEYRIRVERRHQPTLAVRPQCTLWQETFASSLCGGEVLVASLDDVAFEPDRLRFRIRHRILSRDVTGVTTTPEGDRIIEHAAVRDGMLRLRGYTLDGWQPRWGLGTSLAGPAQVVSFNGQYRPRSWLALDAGLMISPSAWVGPRVLFPALGSVRPFLGAFVHGALLHDRNWTTIVGGRAGIDVPVGSEQHVLSLEFNLMHLLQGGGYFRCTRDTTLCPWGGLTYSLLW